MDKNIKLKIRAGNKILIISIQSTKCIQPPLSVAEATVDYGIHSSHRQRLRPSSGRGQIRTKGICLLA